MRTDVERILAGVLAGAAGFFGLLFLFSDPARTTLGAALLHLLHFAVPAFAIGFLFPRSWGMGAIAAWGGPFLVVAALLAGRAERNAPLVEAVVREGSVAVAPASVAGPTIRVRARNAGGATHAIGVTPLKRDGGIEEVRRGFDAETAIREGRPVLGTAPIAPGAETTEVYAIGAGRFAVVCAVEGHAAAGEVAELEVTAP